VQTDNVRFRQQLVERGAAGCGGCAGTLCNQHPHVECLSHAGNCLAEFSKADDSECLSGQFPDRVIKQAEAARVLPVTPPDGCTVFLQAAGKREYQQKNVLHDRGGGVGTHIADGDVFFCSGREVHVVGAGSRDTDQPELVCMQQCLAVQPYLVADDNIGTLNGSGGIPGIDSVWKRPVRQGLQQWFQVKISLAYGADIEEYATHGAGLTVSRAPACPASAPC